MENNDDFEKLISFHVNNEIKKHSTINVISHDELIKIIAQRTGLLEEEIREFFVAFNKVIRKLYKENPEGVKLFFKEKFGGDFTMFDS